MRCLTLAGALRARGAAPRFICREYPQHLCDLIAARGFPVHRLPASAGVTWEMEAAETRSALQSLDARVDWLVFDHYQIDARTESALRDHVGRILVIDDLADRPHDCDLLLDQNLQPQMQTRYRDRVSADCVQLLGPRYALLQSGYAELHDRVPPRAGAIRRVFVFFSGADVDNLTGMTVAAILGLGRHDVDFDVVITSAHPAAESIRDQVRGHPNVKLHTDLPTLAPLMARADLAVGAGGTTSWERACLGLPSLVITIADNQRGVAAGLRERGIVRWLGHKDEVNEASLSHALREVLDSGLDEEWSRRCAEAVDGRGAARVSDALLVDAATPLVARPANAADEDLLLEWANDPVTRVNSFSSQPIPPATHHAWFRGRLERGDACRFFILQTPAQTPVGQVRFDRDGASWEVNYSIAREFRGRRLGRGLMEAALHALTVDQRGAEVRARVKESNLPSRRVFESLGFVRSVDEQGLVYRRSL
jgi:UDP-2,4-diacetamido-2,4,6-trideoxy-beta-L-altropyranose hydrolase